MEIWQLYQMRIWPNRIKTRSSAFPNTGGSGHPLPTTMGCFAIGAHHFSNLFEKILLFLLPTSPLCLPRRVANGKALKMDGEKPPVKGGPKQAANKALAHTEEAAYKRAFPGRDRVVHPLSLNPTGHRMETGLKVLLILGVVTAAPAPSSSPLPTHEDAVLAAVQLYNQEPDITLAYRLLEAEPQPDWDVSSKTIQPLTFTVQETVCPVKEKRDISQCEFKEDGLVKDCSGFFSTEQNPASVIIKCEEASEEPNIVTRGRWSRFRKRAGRFLRRHKEKIIRAAVDIFLS
ncbi:uncharacterized protein LOC141983380 [Natator depressus]|uniref:uncharacterized protein LOC141983380 n=1 Tax=Natator depressus TaxID=27790 RepID=UPI003EC14906